LIFGNKLGRPRLKRFSTSFFSKSKTKLLCHFSATMGVFPSSDGALKVRQSPCQWPSPGPTDTERPVDVESRARIGPPLAFARREKSTAGSRKCAVSPCPPRRDSDAARTASFLGTRAVARSFLSARHCVCPRLCMHRVLSSVRALDPGRATHVRPGLRFVQ